METTTPRLNRSLNRLNVWSLAFGCIIGWGAFMMPGTTFLPKAGPLGTSVAMLIGALIMVIIAFSYSYMVPRYPKSGGEFTFASKCFGRHHAFVCGWLLALAYVANVPMNSTALGLMTRKLFFGVFQFGRMYQVAGYDIWFGEVLLATVAMVVMAVLSVRGVKKAGWVQTVMALSLAGAFAIIVIATVFSPVTHWSNLAPLWSLAANAPDASAWEPMAGILAIVAVAPWAYVGFDTIPQVAEEFSFSARKVNGTMIVAIAFGCIVYSCNTLVTAAASPDWTQFIAQHDWAVGAAVEALMGKPGLVVLGIAVASAILTGMLGFLTATTRLMYSMSREGYLPSAFAKLHPKFHTPHVAIWFCLAVSAFGPWFGRTALGWFVDMSSIGGAVGFGYTAASALATISRKDKVAEHLPFAIMAALGVVFSVGFCVLLLVPGLPGCLGMPSYVMLGVWVALGMVFHAAMNRKEDFHDRRG